MNEWLAGRASVSAEEFIRLQAELTITESYLRRLLREAPGLVLPPAVEGVRQDSFADLERTLLALEDTAAHRRLVLEAKRHARLALRSLRVDRAEKEEMLAWMTVWLETPAAFPVWLELRKRAIAARPPTP